MNDKLTVVFVIPWYANLYLNSCVWFAYLTNQEPNHEKIGATFGKMIKVK